ncbi:MAG: S8 family peptidase [Woeseiaceae bacterium]
MILRALILVSLAALAPAGSLADDRKQDPARDILVTITDRSVARTSGGISAPYRKRKRYAIGAGTRRQATDIAREYSLVEVDRWPIRSLSVFCIVYRIGADADRDGLLSRLRADPRVESAQALQRFETLANEPARYDDTYTDLQRGLEVMDIPAAHRYSQGRGVRVAIVDSRVDANHEDLKGRVREIRILADGASQDAAHGTAVASIIGAAANNARGIVGVAPESEIEVYVACWSEDGHAHAVCDSFTLAKALDEIVDSAPEVLNLSLVGPYDPLLARLLDEVDRAGVVAVAAGSPGGRKGYDFPASLARVIAVGSSDDRLTASRVVLDAGRREHEVYAPGDQIMVALPNDGYDFRSGNSLAAAHVSGVVALLLAVSPNLSFASVASHLRESQRRSQAELPSINACITLQLADAARSCP